MRGDARGEAGAVFGAVCSILEERYALLFPSIALCWRVLSQQVTHIALILAELIVLSSRAHSGH